MIRGPQRDRQALIKLFSDYRDVSDISVKGSKWLSADVVIVRE